MPKWLSDSPIADSPPVSVIVTIARPSPRDQTRRWFDSFKKNEGDYEMAQKTAVSAQTSAPVGDPLCTRLDQDAPCVQDSGRPRRRAGVLSDRTSCPVVHRPRKGSQLPPAVNVVKMGLTLEQPRARPLPLHPTLRGHLELGCLLWGGAHPSMLSCASRIIPEG